MPVEKKTDEATIRIPPHRGIPGISKSALWSSWKEIRKELRSSSWRDIIDFAEFDVDPDKWIGRLLASLRNGGYQPEPPRRFPLGKAKGFSRWMTFPEIPDLVLFHAITTRVAKRASRRRRSHRHVYSLRDEISKAQGEAEAEAKAISSNPYRSVSTSGFLAWLRYHQYRRWLLLKRIHPYIVATDITNFFDSIPHSQLEAFLFELGFQRNFVGLLLLLLERLSVRDSYAPAPRIGLPVDEFDCSRCLAHAVLFPHDDRMVEVVGENAYIRWMDDQTFGVDSPGTGYRVLANLNASLRRMHLTPNSAKTRLISLSQARREYHFVTNDRLDALDNVLKKHTARAQIRTCRQEFRKIWARALKDEGVGEWNKILKRCYRLGGRLGLRALVRRSHEDVILDPGLAEGIARYLRIVCDVDEFVERATRILSDERNVYDDVKRIFAEEFLRLEPRSKEDRKFLRRLAQEALRNRAKPIIPFPMNVACLLILRFGDRRSIRSLKTLLDGDPSGPNARPLGLVLASYGDKERAQVISIAEKVLLGRVRMVSLFLGALQSTPMPDRMKARLGLRFDPAVGKNYIDMRSVLLARLLMVNAESERVVKDIVRKKWLTTASPFESDMLRRLALR